MNDDRPIEDHLGAILRERDETIAVAESCTGGQVGSLITSVTGASEYFIGGIISYMNRTKLQLLAISRETLDEHGTVSRPVAREMAQHIRDEADADWGVSTTGYAGPTSGSTDQPVGTVYVGIAYAGDDNGTAPYAIVKHYQFEGDRHEVCEQIANRTLTATFQEIRQRQ